jgi:hypothetical protein
MMNGTARVIDVASNAIAEGGREGSMAKIRRMIQKRRPGILLCPKSGLI